VGLSHPLWDNGAYGTALWRSATLYDLARSAVSLGPMLCSAIECWLQESGPTIWFCQRFLGGADYAGCDQVEAYGLTRMIQGVRDVVDPDWCPDHIRIPAHAGAAIRHVDALSETRIDYTDDFSAMAIPRNLLPKELPGARSRGSGNAKTVPSMENPPSSLIDSISLLIQTLATEGAPNLRRVADAVGTSGRSLQRRLAESGVTFSEVAAQTRLSLAREMLLDRSVKIIDVGFELGYSDPANFTRAFRRWTGVSPREFRQALEDG
jgi:AraC-like DNA-binding protein